MSDHWLIWSREHQAWWLPGKMGYTRELEKAGRYSQFEARKICDDANRYSERTEETMIDASFIDE